LILRELAQAESLRLLRQRRLSIQHRSRPTAAGTLGEPGRVALDLLHFREGGENAVLVHGRRIAFLGTSSRCPMFPERDRRSGECAIRHFEPGTVERVENINTRKVSWVAAQDQMSLRPDVARDDPRFQGVREIANMIYGESVALQRSTQNRKEVDQIAAHVTRDSDAAARSAQGYETFLQPGKRCGPVQPTMPGQVIILANRNRQPAFQFFKGQAGLSFAVVCAALRRVGKCRARQLVNAPHEGADHTLYNATELRLPRRSPFDLDIMLRAPALESLRVELAGIVYADLLWLSRNRPLHIRNAARCHPGFLIVSDVGEAQADARGGRGIKAKMEARDHPAHHVNRNRQIWPPDWQTLERIDQNDIDRRVIDLHDVERVFRDRGRAEDRLWEVAVLCHLRDAFRAGDIWLAHSRRYGDLKDALVPTEVARAAPKLAMPFEPELWLADRKSRLADGLERLARAARAGAIPGGSIEDGVLKIDRLTAAVPEEADAMVLDLYNRLPEIRITDLLLEVDDEIGFTEAFTHLRTGVPCKDRVGMLNVLLAEGLNLGLSKMAGATNTHDYFQLSRLSRWHVESEAMARALAMVIEGQSALPMARFWGGGVTASSDGQFFPTTRQGEAMNLINAKYGHEPGLKAYTHVSDQFGPFATQTIPATVNEAPYILDGLLMTDAGRKVREQYADTGGFTDHVFAVTALLGFQFIPRIRDLPSKRLYLFNPASCPKELTGLIGGKVREPVISSNWPDILRAAATMVAGAMPPSQLLRKFASYPRQHELAVALREIGRIERTLFIIDWLLDADMQRRAQIGLNKGEAHHALKNALRIGRQGEIRDRTTQGQHFRMAGLNLLAAIIIYWNTKHLGQAVAARQRVGLNCAPDLLAHISPLGWAHILLTGEYRWSKK